MAQLEIQGPATIQIVRDAVNPAAAAAPVVLPTAPTGATKTRSLAPGVFAPVPTFFDPATEELDLLSLQKHVVRLAATGVGSVVSGSNGEHVHLLPAESVAAIQASREALDAAGYTSMPLIAGCGAPSTFEAIVRCREAAKAGADYALVLTDAFYSQALKAAPEAAVQHYLDVADASPIPVLIYNFPAVSGIDLTSDQILRMAQHPNIVGAKLTCANVGKLCRIAAITAQPAFTASGRHAFFLYGGYSDFLLPGLIAKSSGCITGLANVCPRVVKKLFDTGVQAISTCDPQLLRNAQALQDIVAKADAALAAKGIAATKYFLKAHFAYGSGHARKPLSPLVDAAAIAALEEAMKEILALEISLS